MKIILEFPGKTVEDAMTQVRAFAEAWANVYASSAQRWAEQTVQEALDAPSVNNNVSFLDEVSALEQRERDFDKPAAPTRKEVETAFRKMVEDRGGSEEALVAGRAVLKKLGAASVPAIPENKFAECMQLLEELA